MPMTYRIKVIEYESGRKEYVPQVRRRWWHSWKYVDAYGSTWRGYDRRYHCSELWEDSIKAIAKHNKITCQSIIKSTTYKPVQP